MNQDPKTYQTHRLVNFRAPTTIQTMFDEVCSHQSQSRTAVLVSLMSRHIDESGRRIADQLQTIEMIRKGLAENGISGSRQDHRPKSIKAFSDRENGSNPLSIPDLWISTDREDDRW